MNTTKPLLLGLAAPAYSGKDTLADHLVANWQFKTIRIADPIEDSLTQLFQGSHIYWGHYKNNKEERIYGIGISWRQMMQQHGAWLRENGPEFLIGSMKNAIYKHGCNDRWCKQPRSPLVVTDVRTEEEAEAIRNLNGTIVHIYRPDRPTARADITEVTLPLHPSDIVLKNDHIKNMLMQMDDWLTEQNNQQEKQPEPDLDRATTLNALIHQQTSSQET